MTDFARARQNMVDGQIRPASVTDWRIIDAMRVLPREQFLPEARRELAYLDIDIDVDPKGAGRHFLLSPIGTARMLQSAEVGERDHALVVGCATGYFAALTAKLADRVTATIDDEALAQAARANLARLGIDNVTFLVTELGEGAPATAPYDVILLNGATEREPTKLYDQLKMGGRLVGVFAEGKPQRATIVTRSPHDFGARVLFDASVPVLPGLQREPEFVF
ncbi:protein-L-isoaspartate O-methyltransferase [Rhodopseudomonas sp. B29]|uniref:protein-L-isoaspartate O-methyltransferase family protein n=1 Tax=Rhodopseudomonas sp. B29 TaxID=95607 RepID=UPI00034CB803|nr:protein-L-isoaspartate O-methyltransferase [Rhodopseudomonas sp. B29]